MPENTSEMIESKEDIRMSRERPMFQRESFRLFFSTVTLNHQIGNLKGSHTRR